MGAADPRGQRARPSGGAGTRVPPPDRAPGGKGAAAMPGENIFLFVPNLIGECCPRLGAERAGRALAGAPDLLAAPVLPKVTPGLSSPSLLSTSCPAAPSRPPPSTCSAGSWTLSMDTPREPLIKVTDPSARPARRPSPPSVPFSSSSSGPRAAGAREPGASSLASRRAERNGLLSQQKGFKLCCREEPPARVWGGETGHGRAGGLREVTPGGLLCARHKEEGFQSHVSRGDGEAGRIVSAGSINFF